MALGLIIKAAAEAVHDNRKRATEDLTIWETLRTKTTSAAKDVRISHETSICISNAVPLLADDPPPLPGTDQRLQSYLESSCLDRPPRGDPAAASGPRAGHAADFFLYDHPHCVYLTLGVMPHSCAPNTAHSIDAAGALVTRAARSIHRGDVVTRSWMQRLHVSYAERQRSFAALFGVGLVCQCVACARANAADNGPAREHLLHQYVDNYLRYSVVKEAARLTRLEAKERALLQAWKLSDPSHESPHALRAHLAAAR